jgi:hypothetical protein
MKKYKTRLRRNSFKFKSFKFKKFNNSKKSFNSFCQSLKNKIKAKKQLAISLSLISLVLISSFAYNTYAKNQVVPLTTVVSEPTNEATKVITEKIYIKDAQNITFNYEESSIKIKDNKLQ